MTSDAIGQSLLLKMAPVFRDRFMTCQTVGETQQRPGMRLMARAAIVLHWPVIWKSFTLQ